MLWWYIIESKREDNLVSDAMSLLLRIDKLIKHDDSQLNDDMIV